MREHDYEPIPGLPGSLPEGESILWQGAPSWRALAVHALHVRAIAAYFLLLALWQIAAGLYDGGPATAAVAAAVWPLGLGAATVALLAGYAWLVQRTTLYTITTKRVVMRFGVALPMAVNLPFKAIESVSFCEHRDGSCDLALALPARGRLAYLALWPLARPWRFSHPEPMLRCIGGGREVAVLLIQSLQQAVGRLQPMEDERRLGQLAAAE